MARPRITVTISLDSFQYLSEWAEREERSIANVAAFVINHAVKEIRQRDKSTCSKKLGNSK